MTDRDVVGECPVDATVVVGEARSWYGGASIKNEAVSALE
jgi:hypothetical protein